MREILFRGKRVDNGEWVYGCLLQHPELEATTIHCKQEALYQYDGVYLGTIVIPETVGQFTGMTDKNGEKIFEGDICKVTYYNHSSPDTVLQQTVIYSSGTFALQSKDFEPFDIEDTRRYVPLYYMLPPNKIEIIGNIHD